MKRLKYQTVLLAGVACGLLAVTGAFAEEFNIPSGDLKAALDAYTRQAGVPLVYSGTAVRGARTRGVKGDLSSNDALVKLLSGTGFVPRRNADSAITIIPSPSESRADEVVQSLELAQAAPPRAAVETVTVTSSKLGGADVQSIPIAITALSQEQLTATQTAGGPDLVKQVPNLTFSKTNFTGYSIQIRGIGTQAISVTTDPAVAVAFNDIPFIRNHFFEQEFFDVSQVEVLRGPQGTLYGRNATAGVVNLISAKPTDEFEAMASGDIGNYHNRRFEGMLNLPIVDDRVDLRIAGEWTKRDGYSFNALTNSPIDGRDLWSGRVSLSVKPTSKLSATIVWEHFSEDDDRMRTAKQLCKTEVAPTSINGTAVVPGGFSFNEIFQLSSDYLSQGCVPTSLYANDAFQVPYGFSLPYAVAAGVGGVTSGGDPYASTTQSRDLRVIESAINPRYKAKNDVVELNAEYSIAPSLTLTSQTGYNQDFLWSTEDYNRFNTSPGFFSNGVFCDPQLGCSNRLVAQDISDEHAWQLNQELRLITKFSGPLNFSVGGNYLHYETEENYYVFINGLTAFAYASTSNGVSPSDDNHLCLPRQENNAPGSWGYQNNNPLTGGGTPTRNCPYVDPNSIANLNNEGHNYFLSQNPYVLNSYAGFGEAYYSITNDLKFIGGIRWTDDLKHFVNIPSELLTGGYGYYVTGSVDQRWAKITGRAALNWTPKLDFTDQTLFYASFARGYKAGGANPPGAVLPTPPVNGQPFEPQPIHPLTFQPEYINAFELGSKNSLLDGALTLNGDVFYYDYKNYQISEIVDRTSINLNFDATVKGAELEASWEPLPGFKLNFAGGYEDTKIANGQSAVDLMDRTAAQPDWMVVKPFPTSASNCILPTYVIQALLQEDVTSRKSEPDPTSTAFACAQAYQQHLDPVTLYPYAPNPTGLGGINYAPNTGSQWAFPIPNGYPGFDPTNPAINNGAGFAKNVGGNKLPNSPPLTVSIGAQYSMPLSPDWAGTLRGDYYWQDYSWARVFNDNPYDRLRGYTTLNLALILTNEEGWQVMGYLKNVFNTAAITGDFLNSDDSGLTTNVFLTDPRLFGIRITKNW